MAVLCPACTELSAVGAQAQRSRMSGTTRGETLPSTEAAQACLDFTAPFQTSLSLQLESFREKTKMPFSLMYGI